MLAVSFFFFSSRRRHTRLQGDWSSDVCSSDLRRQHLPGTLEQARIELLHQPRHQGHPRAAPVQGGHQARDLGGGLLQRLQVGSLLDLDRKSTRLNSSHLVISYAVFCLKKKKLD